MGELKKGLEARIGGRRGFRRMVFIPSLLSILYSLLSGTALDVVFAIPPAGEVR